MLILPIVKTFTFRRVWNFCLIGLSYTLSRLFRTPVMKGLPWSVSLEPTTSCNLRCPECPTGQRALKRPGGNMSMELFTKILDEMSPYLLYVTLYFQGEPMLSPHFIEMAQAAKKRRLFVSTSTNGHFLSSENARKLVESGLDHLIISLDGTDQETYSKYRIGGKLEEVINGINNVNFWKRKLASSTPFIELQFLVLGTNQHQIPTIRQLSKDLHVNKLSLKSAQLYTLENNPFHTTLSKHSRYSQNQDGRLQNRNKLPNHCYRMWHSAVITWDGKIVPCCFDKDASNLMGDIQTESIETIWHSDSYKLFRNQLISNRSSIAICNTCSEGL